MTKSQSIEKLDALLGELSILRREGRNSHRYPKWKRDVEVAIKHIFNKPEDHLKDFKQALNVPGVATASTPDSYFEGLHQKGLARAEAVLHSMKDEVIEYHTEDNRAPISSAHRKVNAAASGGKKVFIVHGRDGEAKERTARFVMKVGLIPVILHEQASQGKTIIEKIEEFADDVQFAIVLYTPDDEGRYRGDTASEDLRPRGRQNVVFEHGYLMAKLGRSRVAPLVSDGIELPSDISGVVYISNRNWEFEIAREMRAAGYHIDLNLLI